MEISNIYFFYYYSGEYPSSTWSILQMNCSGICWWRVRYPNTHFQIWKAEMYLEHSRGFICVESFRETPRRSVALRVISKCKKRPETRIATQMRKALSGRKTVGSSWNHETCSTSAGTAVSPLTTEDRVNAKFVHCIILRQIRMSACNVMKEKTTHVVFSMNWIFSYHEWVQLSILIEDDKWVVCLFIYWESTGRKGSVPGIELNIKREKHCAGFSSLQILVEEFGWSKSAPL